MKAEIISAHQYNRGLGAVPSPRKDDELKFVAAISPTDLPASADVGIRIKTIFNQGNYNSCTGHALAACVMRYKANHSDFTFIPSRSFGYYNGRLISEQNGDQDVNTHNDNGAYITDVLKGFLKYGLCDQSVAPYNDYSIFHSPSAKAYSYAKALKDVKYKRLPNTAYALKSALAQGLPIFAGVAVYESFQTPQTAQNGFIPMPKPNEMLLGGHAICIDGYDASGNFKFVNSWGKSWGKDGCGFLTTEFVQNSNLLFDAFVLEKC